MLKRKKKQHAVATLDKPLYRYWQALYLAFFNMRLYVDVLKRWNGLGWSYLALLIMLFSIPLATKMTIGFNAFLTTEVIGTFKLLPAMSVQKGQVNLDKPMPYLMKNASGKIVGIVDTTGQITSLENRHYPQLSLLITKNELLYRMPSYQVFANQIPGRAFGQIYAQKMLNTAYGVFDGETSMRQLPIGRLKTMALFVIYPTLVVLFFVVYAGFFLVVGVFARFVAKLLLRAPLTYIQTCRLLAVSSTASVVIFLLTMALDWRFAGMGPILLIILAVYFSLGGLAYRREMSQLARVSGRR